MPLQPIVDLGTLNPEKALYDLEEIRKRIPQRHEMEFLDRIVHFDRESDTSAAIMPVRSDAFWCRGHFPQRPILPGVLMLEAAGQLCSFHYAMVVNKDSILGFGGADGLKFRGTVEPDVDVLLMCKMHDARQRTARLSAQGFIDGRCVFEGNILGVVLSD